jgi:hypothetical protein
MQGGARARVKMEEKVCDKFRGGAWSLRGVSWVEAATAAAAAAAAARGL